MEDNTKLKERIDINIKRPKMYRVILHNDDYTTMEFVVEILVEIFNKNPIEASKIMYDVHKKGTGVAGVYPYDIAATKIAIVMDKAEIDQFPLKLSMEEE